MRNINIKQIILLLIIFFFLFGDFFNIKKKLTNFVKQFSDIVSNKNRKKGT